MSRDFKLTEDQLSDLASEAVKQDKLVQGDMTGLFSERELEAMMRAQKEYEDEQLQTTASTKNGKSSKNESSTGENLNVSKQF